MKLQTSTKRKFVVSDSEGNVLFSTNSRIEYEEWTEQYQLDLKNK